MKVQQDESKPTNLMQLFVLLLAILAIITSALRPPLVECEEIIIEISEEAK